MRFKLASDKLRRSFVFVLSCNVALREFFVPMRYVCNSTNRQGLSPFLRFVITSQCDNGPAWKVSETV
jgi:hypothetical protein